MFYPNYFKTPRLSAKRWLMASLAIGITVGIPIVVIASISVRLAIAKIKNPLPQAILTLGGGHQREVFTAKFAQSQPNLPIWVSSGSKEIRAREIFYGAGLNNRHIYLDRRATDTVTNFTTLVKDFKQQDIAHIYLITDDFHLPRAKAIAFMVLGSQGIAYTPVSLATSRKPEPRIKTVRDVTRSWFWIFTKHTGSSLNRRQGKI